jgi:hypothetical protein
MSGHDPEHALPVMLQVVPCTGHALTSKQPFNVALQVPGWVGQFASIVQLLPVKVQVPGTTGHWASVVQTVALLMEHRPVFGQSTLAVHTDPVPLHAPETVGH